MIEDDHSLTLYHRLQQIYVLIDDGDRRTLRLAGLTPTQYNLLLRLGEQPAEGRTITELSQALLCTRGNITRLARRMQHDGLVACRGDLRDQRLVRVSLTPVGMARLAQARELHRAAIHRRLDTLDAPTREALYQITDQVVATLAADLAAQGPAPKEYEEELIRE
jgi:DNA-binding MarR family transcriptional regulator